MGSCSISIQLVSSTIPRAWITICVVWGPCCKIGVGLKSFFCHRVAPGSHTLLSGDYIDVAGFPQISWLLGPANLSSVREGVQLNGTRLDFCVCPSNTVPGWSRRSSLTVRRGCLDRDTVFWETHNSAAVHWEASVAASLGKKVECANFR